MNKTVESLKAEKQIVGAIIDDRSMNSIQFGAYVEQYKELERLIEAALKEGAEG